MSTPRTTRRLDLRRGAVGFYGFCRRCIRRTWCGRRRASLSQRTTKRLRHADLPGSRDMFDGAGHAASRFYGFFDHADASCS